MSTYFHYLTSIIYGLCMMYLLLNVEFTQVKRICRVGFLLCGVFLLCSFSTVYFCCGVGMLSRFYPLLVPVPMVFMYCFVSRYRGLKLIFTMLTTVLFAAPYAYAPFLLNVLFAIPVSVGWKIATVIPVCVVLLTWKFIKPRFNYVLEYQNHYWGLLSLLPLSAYLSTLLIGRCNYSLEAMSATGYARITIIFIAAMAYILIFLFFRQIREQALLKEENHRLAMQTAQYESLRERMEDTRRARHDLRQHLRLIQAYLDSGNQVALQDYIRAYGQTLPPDNGKRYCENEIVNTVVRFYAEQAEEAGVQVETKLLLPNGLNISEPDLCALLGNLLENALFSCRNHIDEAPLVRMCGQIVGARTLTITVDNRPADKPHSQQDRFLSTKRKGFGTGTDSIRSIAQRYDGEARFEWRDFVFYAAVVLTLPETCPSQI